MSPTPATSKMSLEEIAEGAMASIFGYLGHTVHVSNITDMNFVTREILAALKEGFVAGEADMRERAAFVALQYSGGKAEEAVLALPLTETGGEK